MRNLSKNIIDLSFTGYWKSTGGMALKTGFFMKDSYHTEKNTHRLFLDRLMLNTRLYFMFKYLRFGRYLHMMFLS
jgi:hypothetical protein